MKESELINNMKKDLKERLQDYINDIDWSIKNCEKELQQYINCNVSNCYDKIISYRKGEIDCMKEINEVLIAIVKGEL